MVHVYRKSDNVFIEGPFRSVPNVDSGAFGTLTLPDNVVVDTSLHRFDGVNNIRLATGAELAATSRMSIDDQAIVAAADRALKSAIIAVFWQITGARPTNAELVAIRTKYMTVYKELSQ